MQNRVEISIIKETHKACLVEAEGKKGWVQKRWLRADNTVAANTFAKAVESHTSAQAHRDKIKAFQDGYHCLEIERETDKAVAVKAFCEECVSDQVITRLAWFPKSVMREGKIPGWLIDRKREEIYESVKKPHIRSIIVTIGGV